MDIQAIVDKLVAKIKEEPNLLAEIKAGPAKKISELVGEIIPEDSIKQILEQLESKLKDGALGKAEEKLKEHGGVAGVFDSIKKLFK